MNENFAARIYVNDERFGILSKMFGCIMVGVVGFRVCIKRKKKRRKGHMFLT